MSIIELYLCVSICKKTSYCRPMYRIIFRHTCTVADHLCSVRLLLSVCYRPSATVRMLPSICYADVSNVAVIHGCLHIVKSLTNSRIKGLHSYIYLCGYNGTIQGKMAATWHISVYVRLQQHYLRHH